MTRSDLTGYKTPEVSDGGLKQRHLGGGIVKVDLRDVLQDLVDNVPVPHDQRRAEGVDGARPPSVPVQQHRKTPSSAHQARNTPVIRVSVRHRPQRVVGKCMFVIPIPRYLKGVLDGVRPVLADNIVRFVVGLRGCRCQAEQEGSGTPTEGEG